MIFVRGVSYGHVTERGEVLISRSLRAECDHLDNEAQARALKLAPMHVTNWEEAQREDALLAACHKWLSKKKSVIPQKRDALLKECMSEHSTSEEGKALFRVRNSLTLRKGLMYVNITPKGETEGLLAFRSAICTQAHSLKWSAPRRRTPRSAEDIGACQRAFLVAENGGRLPSLSERLPALPNI